MLINPNQLSENSLANVKANIKSSINTFLESKKYGELLVILFLLTNKLSDVYKTESLHVKNKCGSALIKNIFKIYCVHL